MKLHGNARTCPKSRRLLVERIESTAWSLPAVMPHVLYAGRSRLRQAMRLTAQLVERVPVFYAKLRDDLATAGEQAAHILEATLFA